MKIYGGNYAEFPIPQFRVGDVVRLKQFKEAIQGGKSLDVNFTPELYVIRKVNRGYIQYIIFRRSLQRIISLVHSLNGKDLTTLIIHGFQFLGLKI